MACMCVCASVFSIYVSLCLCMHECICTCGSVCTCICANVDTLVCLGKRSDVCLVHLWDGGGAEGTLGYARPEGILLCAEWN